MLHLSAQNSYYWRTNTLLGSEVSHNAHVPILTVQQTPGLSQLAILQ